MSMWIAMGSSSIVSMRCFGEKPDGKRCGRHKRCMQSEYPDGWLCSAHLVSGIEKALPSWAGRLIEVPGHNYGEAELALNKIAHLMGIH